MNRIGISILIGVILAAAVFAFDRLVGIPFFNRNEEPVAEVAEGGEPVAAVQQLPEGSQTVNIGGVSLVLQPSPESYARLASEAQPVPQPTAVPQPEPTQQPVVEVQQDQQQTEPTAAPPTNTPVPVVPTVAPVVTNNTGSTIAHTVVAGETRYSLAQRYGSSVELMAQYGITQEDMIVGNVINIPVGGTVNCSALRQHVVSAGQNVFRLAIQYGVTKESIRDLNGLPANYLIEVGQVLCIPNN